MLANARKILEQENERRSAQNRMAGVEVANKESELENAIQLLEREKEELEIEHRENYIREIQARQIEIEERKRTLANNEHELRRQQRLKEKKKELIQADNETLIERQRAFDNERAVFEELAQKINETSERLAEERSRVLEEKAVFDNEKEQLDKIKFEIDTESSLLQQEFMQAEELEHELAHRENMLKMLIFNKENRDKGWNEMPSHVPPYTSCPNLKKENFNRQTNLSPTSEVGYKQSLSPTGHAQELNNQAYQNQLAYDDRPRFDYNRYMQQLQQKLGDYTVFRSGEIINRDRMSNFHNNMHQEGESLSRQAAYPGH